MRKINKLVLIAGIIIFLCAPGWGAVLKKIEIDNSENSSSIKLIFNKVPRVSIDRKNNDFLVFIKDTKVSQDVYPENIGNGLVIGFDISQIGADIAIKFQTKGASYIEKHLLDNTILLNLKKKSDGSVSKSMPFVIPSAPKNITFPSERHKYRGKHISIDVQDADIQNVLRLLAQIGGFNLVLSDDVQGKITLSLHDVPWDQVLDIVLSSKNLGMVKRGNVIRIAPLKTLQMETEQLAQIKAALSKEENVAPLKTAYLQVNYAKAANLAKQIQALLSERGTVTYDDRTNKIILKDVPAVIKKAKELIAKLDEPVKQVLIEAKIVEINNTFEHRLGIRWSGAAMQVNNSSFVSASPQTTVTLPAQKLNDASISVAGVSPPVSSTSTTTSTTSTTPASSAIVDLGVIGTTTLGLTWGTISQHSALLLDVQLSAMEEEGLAKIISSPKIITMDHLPAEINQGFKIPYLEQTQDGISTKFIDAGLSLKVVPHVTPDNRISLEIDVEKSAPDWSNTVNGVPTIITRAAKSKVLVENGETIVIGGIKTEDLTESHGKVPGLGDLPGVGNLFKNKEYQDNKAELLIFITARVVSADVKNVDY